MQQVLHDPSDIEKGLAQAAAKQEQTTIPPPRIAVRKKTQETIARAGNGADRSEELDVARPARAQEIQGKVKDKTQPEPGRGRRSPDHPEKTTHST